MPTTAPVRLAALLLLFASCSSGDNQPARDAAPPPPPDLPSACAAYCAAFGGACGGGDRCDLLCTLAVKETPAACAQTRSEYYACAKSGPFTCTRLFGLTPEGCGLDKLNACLLTAGRACERWESLDGACRRDKGNDFLGFACRTDGDLPTGCVPTKASSEQAALRTACCPAATSGTP